MGNTIISICLQIISLLLCLLLLDETLNIEALTETLLKGLISPRTNLGKLGIFALWKQHARFEKCGI
jgi:hypothetical protein